MRRTSRGGSFIFSLLINMLLNPEGFIVAGILIALHFIFGLSLWWAGAVFVLWIARLVIGMLFMGWAIGCGKRSDPPKENKNPYSVKKGDE